MLSEENQTQNVTYMIIWNVQTRWIHRDRKWISGCPGLGEEIKGEWLLMGRGGDHRGKVLFSPPISDKVPSQLITSDVNLDLLAEMISVKCLPCIVLLVTFRTDLFARKTQCTMCTKDWGVTLHLWDESIYINYFFCIRYFPLSSICLFIQSFILPWIHGHLLLLGVIIQYYIIYFVSWTVTALAVGSSLVSFCELFFFLSIFFLFIFSIVCDNFENDFKQWYNFAFKYQTIFKTQVEKKNLLYSPNINPFGSSFSLPTFPAFFCYHFPSVSRTSFSNSSRWGLLTTKPVFFPLRTSSFPFHFWWIFSLDMEFFS